LRGGGVNTAHAAGEDDHEHTTTRTTRRTDTLEVHLGPDDFSEHDLAVEVSEDWSIAADIRYDNYDNYWNDGPPVGTATFSDMDFKVSGEFGTGVVVEGGYKDDMTVNIRDSLIEAAGVDVLGVAVVGQARVRLDKVSLDVKAVDGTSANNPWSYAGGISAWGEGARVDVSGSTMRVENGFGIELTNGARVNLDRSQLRASGSATAHGLKLTETDMDERLTPANRVTLKNGSVVQAPDASAVWVEGRAENQLDATGSRLSGDRLVTVDGYQTWSGSAGSKLTFDARNSQLVGGADVHERSRLTLTLQDRSDWEIRPDAAGKTRSEVTLLSLQDSDIRFNANDTGLYQRLVVGHGDTGGKTGVYQALGGNARISLNTFLNDGGALANQHTDRLVILGDASGSTWLHVNPVAGSPGAETGDTASDGISLAQVYGQATGQTFKLAGEYVAVGPYQYRLQSFDPDESDPGQRDPQASSTGKFWDYRLLGSMSQSGFGDSSTPDVVPQLPSYLAAPTAIFQARLLDIDTWHRRLGDARHAGGVSAKKVEGGAQPDRHDVYLRTYGGDYDYRSQSGASSYASKTRYHAVQAGGNVINQSRDDATWRVGAAVSAGDLTFRPQGIDGNRKTRLKSWAVSPTTTWQHGDGGYVDALVAAGGFKGDVSTRQRGKTATLKGKSAAASVEAGVPFNVGDFTVLPQAQAVYQHLKFDRTRDVDGIDVNLGTHKQVTLRSGGEIRKALQTRAGHAIQVYGKVHVAHTVNDSKKVDLSGDFRTGKTGTVLETGMGVDAALAKGRGVLYADLTRQSRIGRAGHNGWSANAGVRVRF